MRVYFIPLWLWWCYISFVVNMCRVIVIIDIIIIDVALIILDLCQYILIHSLSYFYCYFVCHSFPSIISIYILIWLTDIWYLYNVRSIIKFLCLPLSKVQFFISKNFILFLLWCCYISFVVNMSRVIVIIDMATVDVALIILDICQHILFCLLF